MTQLTIQQAQAYAAQAGFTNAPVPGTNGTQIQVMTAILLSENGLNIPGKIPQDTFHSAYSTYALGGGFQAFPSFANGSFKSNLQTASIGSNTIASTLETPVTDIFAKANIEQWWNEPHVNFFGQNNEQGQDYGMRGGFNTPVGAIMGGKVVMSSTLNERPPNGWCSPGNNSVGWVVQIMTPNDGLHHYQHLRSAHVKKGDTIGAGEIVGLSGGCAEGFYGTGSNRGCTCYDGWSEGNHIEVRWAPGAKGPGWAQDWQDPKDHFIALSKLSAVTPLLSSGSSNGGVSGLAQSLANFAQSLPGSVAIAPDANVANFLEAIDLNLSIRNPFDTGAFGETVGTISVLGADFENPIQWFGDVAWNLMLDMGIIGLRGTIVATGIFICWKVLGSTILGQVGESAASAGTTIASIGAI